MFGSGDERDVVVFGAAGPAIVRVEAFPAGGGAAIAADVIDVPDDLSSQANAFVLVVVAAGGEQIDVNAYDADGRTVAYSTIGSLPDPGNPVEAPPDA